MTEFDDQSEEDTVDIRISDGLLPADAQHGTPAIRGVEIGVVYVKNRQRFLRRRLLHFVHGRVIA